MKQFYKTAFHAAIGSCNSDITQLLLGDDRIDVTVKSI